MTYKLNIKNLDLASAFERFQMLKYGNCVVLQSALHSEDDAMNQAREKEIGVIEQHYLLTDDEL